ncbi:MAG: hypothetical protein H7Z21_20490 [Hymenobacter sp.]|nr:hypothetical protein [Hymenobacter sp.]
MKHFFLSALLLGSSLTLLLPPEAAAQTPLGQPTFDEQKVQVWCATAKFVYEDNGRPNLKNTLRCGGSLKEFENGIRADSQRVYSALYQPLEGRGAIYKGLGSNPSRLQKLKTEIVSRLKSSPARRASPARMQRLATLETALTNYVQNGTPIGDQPGEAPETPDETSETDEAAPVDAGPEEAGITRPAEPVRPVGESLMNKFFAPLSLIMALLSLVLYGLMRRNLAVFQQELATRIMQRQDEIMATRSPPAASTPPVTVPELSPELRREVERLIVLRLDAELARRPPGTAPSTEVTAPEPAVPASVAVAPRITATPVAAVTPAPVAALTPPRTIDSEAAETAGGAPGTSPSLNAPLAPVPPVVPPAGSPVPAPPDDFNGMVPPVLLSEPMAASAAESVMRYGPAPAAGLFAADDLTAEHQPDSIYEIYLDPQWPELASFQVSGEPTVQAYLLETAPPDLLADSCEYEQPTGPVARIVTEEEGILRRVAGGWHVEQKAVVRFEG